MDINLIKLFFTNKPYETENNDTYFLKALKATIGYFIENNIYYKDICNNISFDVKDLKNIDYIHKIPILPTLFLKKNDLTTKHKAIIEVTSSGTRGKVSKVRYSVGEIILGAKMALTMGIQHKLFSLKPTHYIMLGYEPTRKNKAIISKTAYLSTWYALGRSRTYALKYKKGKYKLDLEILLNRIIKLSKKRSPIRIVGFPSYMFFLLQKMKEKNIKCTLPKGSKILLGGGWKEFSGEEVSKLELFKLIEEVLGVASQNIHEFFGAAEHPVLYCTCKNHKFHIPAYGKVIIRDVNTFEPVENGQVGLINLLTPIQSSVPICSIITDDLGIVHNGENCSCGIKTDYIEILGRVGVKDIKTCSVGAKEYLKELAYDIN